MHIYAIIYAYNLIYCLNNFFLLYSTIETIRLFPLPTYIWGCGQGGRLLPLPPLISPSPPPPTPCLPPPFSERCALRARKIPSLSFFLPSRPLFFPPPSPSSPSSRPLTPHIPLPPIISHLPLTLSAPHISLTCSKTVQRMITLTLLTHVFGKVYFVYHCAVCFNTTILWVL